MLVDKEVIMGSSLWQRVMSMSFLILLIWIGASFSVYSSEAQKTVRVGWYVAAGLEDVLEDQTPAGYNYEYLIKIKQYTSWQYEFVYCTWPEAEAALIRGDVDLVGDVAKTVERQQKYEYCAYPSGYSHMVMVSRRDDDRFGYDEYRAFDGKIVATVPSSFRKYLLDREGKKHGFTVQYKEYQTEQDMFAGLDRGEADLAILSDVTDYHQYKAVSEWEANPFYFVVNKQRPDLLEDLNRAMKKIGVTDPFLQERLFKKYFESSATGTITAFTREEMDYIAQHPLIKVLIVQNNAPVSYMKEGKAAGIAPDYMRELALKCGMQIEFIPCESYQEMYNRFMEGEGDVCTPLRDDVLLAEHYGARLTRPYLVSSYGLVSHTEDKEDIRTVVVVQGRTKLIGQLRDLNLVVLELPDAEACLNAVVSRQADGAVLNELEYGWLAYHAKYEKLSYRTIPKLSTSESIGVSVQRDKVLFSILNKGVHAVSEAGISEIISQNSVDSYHYNFNDYLRYGSVYLLPVAILLFAVFFLLSWNRKQRKFNQKLKAEKLRADDANKAKSAFFATISHDMRTPLNGVIGYTELALEAVEMGKVREYLSKIQISGGLLLSLINDVLDFGKYLSHKIRLQPEPVQIAHICKDVETVIRPLAEHKNITFRVERKTDYHSFVEADALRLQQLFVNLLSNAVKFTQAGGIVENILTEKDEGDCVDCTILVRDNGIGMSKEFLPKIFEAYAQEERWPDSGGIGTGLGMAIVKEIVTLMGGTITVKSEINEGTTFTVRLCLKKYYGPVVKEEGIPAPEQQSQQVLQGKRVLLCEDNALNAEIAQTILQQWGMTVQWVSDGRQAVEAIKKAPELYDLVLMDKRMPVMDGIEATKQIRAHEKGKTCHVPILAMTGDLEAVSIQMCLDAGMDGYVGKPINREKLLQDLIGLLQ